MKIFTRIAIGYALILAICLSVFVYAAMRMTTLADSVETVAGSRLVQINHLQDLRNSLNAQGHQVRNILISSDRRFQDAELKKALGRIDTNAQLITGLKQSARTAEAAALVEDMQRYAGPFAAAVKQTAQLAMEGQPEAARTSLLGEMRERQMPLFKAVDDAMALQLTRSTAMAHEATDQATASAWTMGWLGLIAAALSMVTLWRVTRYLRLAIGGEPGEAKSVIQNIAQGDLCPKSELETAPPGSVMSTLGEMRASLAQIVSQVRISSDSIATGSAEIASGNADLSHRTEQQASKLQQTTASTEQIASTLRVNAETAQEATSLAAQAAQAAQHGGDMVGAVVNTMQEISTSSKKIGDIIGVIDGIAFQTNILALNAAVEAARAGEQGRGFAVVAAEVRSLAQRSAEAAKEIKALINASVDTVAMGAQQVDVAGTSMTEIVSQVQRVSLLITEISAATAQQSDSVSGVSEAVAELDNVTQQNAALVEESAAAADSLRQQAVRLMGAVSAFKLGPTGGMAQVQTQTQIQAETEPQKQAAGSVPRSAASVQQPEPEWATL